MELYHSIPWVPEDIFFLIDADGSRWSRVNEAQSAEEKADTDTWEGPEDVRLIEVSLYF